MEIWKTIKDYPKYEISSIGRHRNKKGTILGHKYSKDGYVRLQFCVNGKNFFKMAHRIVLETFIGPPPNPDWKVYQVNHINGIKDDNRLENLEWVTAKQNQSESRIRNPNQGNWKKTK